MRARSTVSFGVRLLALALLLCGLSGLSGCLPPSKDWTHPRIADPRKEDMQFEVDTKFCEDKVGRDEDKAAHNAAMADCYRRLGWQRKD